MKKFALLLASMAVVGALAVPAQAATGSDTASLTVNVPTAISITFSDDSSDFGMNAAGTTEVLTNELSYSVDTNNAAGFAVNVSQVQAGDPKAVFAIRTNGGSTWHLADGGAGAAVVNNHRVETTAGVFNYQDDTRVALSGTAAGIYSLTLTYTATTA